ncbi:hypothetical protein [Variovorax sp. GT1P44]|uniref:hypothetical protein n=1 Tax=Variovorax sp. GT1P44 TaxID=3443742 RepID=UPI003F449727
MTVRITPAEPPFPAGIQSLLDGLMRGKPPLVLFTTLARDPRLFQKFFAGGLLDRGNLTLRQRELVIARTTALCRSNTNGASTSHCSHRTPDSMKLKSFRSPPDNREMPAGKMRTGYC